MNKNRLTFDTHTDNTDKTYREFADKWLPYHARKRRLSPNTYDSYKSLLNIHILPYFGDRIVSTITSEDIDDFLDYLSMKPSQSSNSYNKSPDQVPTLGSATIKKCYTVLTASFTVARSWRYIHEIPYSEAPGEKTKKRNAWPPQKVRETTNGITEDKLLRLAVHIAFVCSLRAGETAGLDIGKIDLDDGSFWVMQEVQRVSDEALSVLPKNEILYVFPKIRAQSKTSLILKAPKNDGSIRKQYLTTPLMADIRERLEDIAYHKMLLGEEYRDYGLLICNPDGTPIDPKALNRSFKKWQKQQGISDRIEFQGLRKSGQMHKVRLTQNNYQLVAENGGQSPAVLMRNYNEALECEKKELARMVEDSFYSGL